jgi:hypothetical protein
MTSLSISIHDRPTFPAAAVPGAPKPPTWLVVTLIVLAIALVILVRLIG